MKKLLMVLTTLALIAGVGVMRAEAAETGDIAVTVTAEKLDIALSAATWAIGTVKTSTTKQMSEADDITVTNNGNTTIDLSLKLTNPAGWTAGSAAGANTYVLGGLFVAGADAPTAAGFTADDVITTTAVTASATQFGAAGMTADGDDIAAAGTVDLWLQFKSPTSTTVTTQQSITVTVGAVSNIA